MAPEVNQQPRGGGDMQTDEETEGRGLGLRLRFDQVIPAKDRRRDHRLTQARDREELGDALDKAHHDGLDVRDHEHPPVRTSPQDTRPRAAAPAAADGASVEKGRTGGELARSGIGPDTVRA